MHNECDVKLLNCKSGEPLLLTHIKSPYNTYVAVLVSYKQLLHIYLHSIKLHFLGSIMVYVMLVDILHGGDVPVIKAG